MILLSGRRVIVTDSWVIRTGTYRIYVAHQNDIHLTLEKAEQHEISPLESIGGVQFPDHSSEKYTTWRGTFYNKVR